MKSSIRWFMMANCLVVLVLLGADSSRAQVGTEIVVERYESGERMSEIPYREGLRHGVATWYYANGNPSQVIAYENGVVQGTALTFYESGALSEERPHRNDQLHGVHREYYDVDPGDSSSKPIGIDAGFGPFKVRIFKRVGQLRAEVSYVEGVRHGPARWRHLHGKLNQEQHHENGVVQGMVRTYYESGALAEERPHRNDRLHGVHRQYYDVTDTPIDAGKSSAPSPQSEPKSRLRFARKDANGFESSGELLYKPEFYVEFQEVERKRYRPEGPFKVGALQAEIPYTDGQSDGLATWYFPNGKLTQEVLYVAGLVEGLTRTYYESGAPHEERPHRNQRLHGIHKKFYESGIDMEVIPYIDGKIHGVARWFHPNGKLYTQTGYSQDNPCGVSRTWDWEGKLTSSQVHPPCPAFNDSLFAASPTSADTPRPTVQVLLTFERAPEASIVDGVIDASLHEIGGDGRERVIDVDHEKRGRLITLWRVSETLYRSRPMTITTQGAERGAVVRIKRDGVTAEARLKGTESIPERKTGKKGKARITPEDIFVNCIA